MIDVIVPIRNEIQAVLNTVRVLSEKEGEIRAIFIDGHSLDGTYEILQRECGHVDNFLVTRQKDLSKGKGGALREGVELSRGDIIVFLDGDIESLRSEWIDKLVDPIEEGRAQITKGNFDYEGEDFVTECVARPLLRALFPEVDFNRPIEGEMAFSRDALEDLEILPGFQAESGLVIDISLGDFRTEEVHLGKKVHGERKGASLKKLADEVHEAILKKGLEKGRI